MTKPAGAMIDEPAMSQAQIEMVVKLRAEHQQMKAVIDEIRREIGEWECESQSGPTTVSAWIDELLRRDR